MDGRSRVRVYQAQDFQALDIQVLNQQSRICGAERLVGKAQVLSLGGDAAELNLFAHNSGENLIDFIFLEEGDFSYLGTQGWVPLNAELIVAPHGLLRRGRFKGPWRATAVRLSSAELESFVPSIPQRIGTFERRSSLENAMHAFTSALMKGAGSPASAIESYAMEQLLLEMGGAALLDRLGGGWNRGTPQAVLRDRALAVLAQRCADPELTPARVAHDTQTSLRQLQAVFAAADATVAGEIRRQRARLAHSLLRDSRYDVLSVEQVAARSGFGTTMSMRRALTDIYGFGPRELRRDRHPVLS